MQALTLLNHQFTLDMAQVLAERVAQQASGNESGQIELLYQLLYARGPTPEEITECQALIKQAGLPALCRALLNTSEFVYID